MDSSNSLSPAICRYMDLFRFRMFHLCSTDFANYVNQFYVKLNLILSI